MDQRIVYGTTCTWWDGIGKAGKHPKSGLPCCPYCRGMLYEAPSMEEFMVGVEEHEQEDPGYTQMLRWMQGKCFPSFYLAKRVWEALSRP